MRLRRRARGVTLLEFLIALAILEVLVSAVYLLLFAATSEAVDTQVAADLELHSARIASEIEADLREARGVSLPPDGTYSSLTFAGVAGYSPAPPPGVIPECCISWSLSPADPSDPPNSSDDNADGLVDESRIVRSDTFSGLPARSTTDRATGSGLRFTLTRLPGQNGVPGDSDDRILVEVRVTLQGVAHDGRLLTRSSSRIVSVRN